MEIAFNWWAILICGVVAMILGSIWYGPMFGKLWMKIIGAPEMDEQKKKEMQKKAMPLYLVQFVLVLFQVWVLQYYILTAPQGGAVTHAIWLWAGFVMPTVAAGTMWTNIPRKLAWAQFFIQAGYQLLCFVVFALILSW